MTISQLCPFAFNGVDRRGQATNDLIQASPTLVHGFKRQKKSHSPISSLTLAGFAASDLKVLGHFLVEAAALAFLDVGTDRVKTAGLLFDQRLSALILHDNFRISPKVVEQLRS